MDNKIVFLIAAMTIASVIGLATSAFAEGKRPFTGLYVAVGQQQSTGSFSLSHEGSQLSFGQIFNVPLEGDTATYEVGYRLPIGASNLRLGINAVLHDGAIGGSKSWHSKYVSAAFTVTSDLRLSLGTEVGVLLGKRERLYAHAGAGVVATNLTAGLSIDTPWGGWADQKEGGAIGAIYRIGLAYQVSDRLSVGLSASQMSFNAGKAFDIDSIGKQNLSAELKQTTVGVNVSYNF
ncbi:outer membrane beta-barrel protein [Patescibacteria group bacterium]|nr:outer membrane beta-barrel protein [Patescibacteria group bacterium]